MQVVRAKIVIDATGSESRIIARENPYFARGSNKALEPGYQIAYGFIAHTDSLGPYDMVHNICTRDYIDDVM